MPGTSFSVSFNGRRYAVSADLEPEVTLGGLVNKATLRNGDGTALPQKDRITGAVRGLQVRCRLANGDLEALNTLAGVSGVSMKYAGPDGNFEGTGFIEAGEEGIKMNQMTGLTETFAFICENGQPLKRQ